MDLLLELGISVAGFWLVFRSTRVLETRLAVWAAKTPSKADDLLVPLLGAALRAIAVVFGIILGLPLLSIPIKYASLLSTITSIAVIVVATVLMFRTIGILQSVVLTRYDITATDNLRARRVHTLVRVVSRISYVTTGVIAVAAVLMLFQEVRHVGVSLLASAGLVGVIGGFAAQKTLANMFAGFQIAFAQPVRQDDVVVVEGEWGRVEEITLTNVIIHIWDDRRLILPLSYFIEKPFQNWTRTSSVITGTVLIWVDYSFPVESARAALRGIVETNPLWDRRFWNLQVSDANDRAMQLRVLATSADSSKSWDLRCEIREKLIAFIQHQHPQSLPLVRGLVDGASDERALFARSGQASEVAMPRADTLRGSRLPKDQ
jgi:small-conductance mechanosensitive channel